MTKVWVIWTDLLNFRTNFIIMNITYNYQHVSGSKDLESYTAEKLQTIFDRYDWVTRADVFFRLENTSTPDSGKIAEIRLSAPGNQLFSEESHASFHGSINKVVDQLKKQCEKRKADLIKHL